MRILPVHRKLSVLERCPYCGDVRMERFGCRCANSVTDPTVDVLLGLCLLLG